MADVAREAKLISSVDSFFPLLASAKKETCETNVAICSTQLALVLPQEEPEKLYSDNNKHNGK